MELLNLPSRTIYANELGKSFNMFQSWKNICSGSAHKWPCLILLHLCAMAGGTESYASKGEAAGQSRESGQGTPRRLTS